MIKRSVKEIAWMAGGSILGEKGLERVLHGVSTDTRSIEQDQLYIPLQGERFDGHDFIDKAIARGAGAALWSCHKPIPQVDIPLILVEDTLTAMQELAKAYRSQLRTTVIGITGSNGKTSTKDILAGILGTKFKTQKTYGNFNNQIGVPLTLLGLAEDTEMAVVEMGMFRLGEIRLLTTLAAPDVAIITNIGEAHMEWMKTKENVVQAKLEILEGLKENGLFIHFGDDPLLQKGIEERYISNKRLTFGQAAHNQYRPLLQSIGAGGITFQLDLPGTPSFCLAMLGKHQMMNATAAIAAAQSLGMSLAEIRLGLRQVEATGMRNELIVCKGYTILNDAYKSNPPSLRAALETLYDLKGYSQKIAVLGDMTGLGEEAPKMHREIGKELDSTQLDYIFTLGQLAQNLAEGATGGFAPEQIVSLNSKEELIAGLRKVTKENAILLIKGSREMQLEDVVEQLKG